MSERALEFVETWVAENVDEAADLPARGEDSHAETLAAECIKAAAQEGIPESEIHEAFDDLTAFIEGQIEEARERRKHAAGEDEDDYEDEKKDD